MKLPISDHEIDEIRQAARLMVRELGLLADSYQNIGITLAERHLLLEIASSEKMTGNAIAARLLLDKSTTSRLIARAVRKGFVCHEQDNLDRRKRFLELTVKGRQTIGTVEPLARKQVRDALDTLDLTDVLALQSGLQAFAKGLIQARQRRESLICKT